MPAPLARRGYEWYEGVEIKLDVGNKSGYAGVIQVRDKFQARMWDKASKQQRAVPGSFDDPRDAAKHLVECMQLVHSVPVEERVWGTRPRKRRRDSRPNPPAPPALTIALPLPASMVGCCGPTVAALPVLTSSPCTSAVMRPALLENAVWRTPLYAPGALRPFS